MAFPVRSRIVTDTRRLPGIQCGYLPAHESNVLASAIDTRQALSWPEPGGLGGDAIWMGVPHREAHVGVFIRSV